jgi:5-methylcytosine-specific restriction endonuclease McrA
MSRTVEECPACHEKAVLRRPTVDCECRVCVVCAEKFLENGQCGLCGVLFLDDDDPEAA